MHQPFVRVLCYIARALNLSAETVLAEAGLLDADNDSAADRKHGVEGAIRADRRLSADAKRALITVHRGVLTAPE